LVWASIIALAVLWALGVGGSYALGGLIHVLMAAAIVLATYRITQKRRARGAS
jgi:hypothetical protein